MKKLVVLTLFIHLSPVAGAAAAPQPVMPKKVAPNFIRFSDSLEKITILEKLTNWIDLIEEFVMSEMQNPLKENIAQRDVLRIKLIHKHFLQERKQLQQQITVLILSAQPDQDLLVPLEIVAEITTPEQLTLLIEREHEQRRLRALTLELLLSMAPGEPPATPDETPSIKRTRLEE
jgi:hypothetical protein